ncbi:MAG: hypothetical protein IPK33_05815 [Gemmatimonadetes bacterium]|nr:hypothetical protein [Gemmatimonadota bacterium]
MASRKIALLEATGATVSITGAAKALGMSHRRAWVLLEETNALFTTPVSETAQGGRKTMVARRPPRSARRS